VTFFPDTGGNVVSKSDNSPPTLAELLRELATELTTLLRQELTLARIEVSHSFIRLFSSLGALVTGFAMLYAGFLLLLAAAVFGLAVVVPVWLAALGVGLLISLAGGTLVLRGRDHLKAGNLTPSRSPHSLREDAHVLLGRSRS
jgi:uncharacterized membrane protein YqjE